MRDYFARRLLLIPPTLLGITLIVFLITRVVPGGPIERAIMEAKTAENAMAGGADSGRGRSPRNSWRNSRRTTASTSRP
jgi:microcin C transport system permease protein